MSEHKVLLDTNVVGMYLNKSSFAIKILKPDVAVSISVIIQLKFLSNPELTLKNRFVFEEFLELIEVFPVEKENAELINHIVAIRKKYNLKLPDAIIAATPMVNNATLISADAAFSKIYNLKFQLIKA